MMTSRLLATIASAVALGLILNASVAAPIAQSIQAITDAASSIDTIDSSRLPARPGGRVGRP